MARRELKTLSQLGSALLELVSESRRALPEMTHGPTVGDVYEGMTARFLTEALPYELFVSKGFLRLPGDELSGEMDCIVSTAQGDRYPCTDKYIVPWEKALVVIQIKASIYGKDVRESWGNLESVLGKNKDVYKRKPVERDLIKSIMSHVLKKDVPDRIQELSLGAQGISNLITHDLVAPTRIAIGYDGFKTEDGFRKSVREHVLERIRAGDADPFAVPIMLLNDKFACVKLTGHPWLGTCTSEQGPFEFLVTFAHDNWSALLLECVYTRVSRIMSVPLSFWWNTAPELRSNLLFHIWLTEADEWVYTGYTGFNRDNFVKPLL